jgi:predicted NUDIX family NTP pyrophosphohydrolase
VKSAGLLLYRRTPQPEVLLVHMGGPFWARKDVGAWTIPKGEYGEGEDGLTTALREFAEELGAPPPSAPDGSLLDLGEVRQKAGKTVRAWAVEGDFDVATLASNTFEIEWPPRSGRRATFPEVDRASWFSLDDARARMIAAQAEFIDRLAAALADRSRSQPGTD